MRRRRLLASTGLLVAGTIAGCAGLTDDTDTPGATDTVENYFDAVSDGDGGTANQFAHPEGEYYFESDDHPFLGAQDLTLTSTETVDVEQAVRSMFETSEETDIDEVIEDEKSALQERQDEYGFTEYAYVRHDATADEITFNPVLLLFEGEDGWVIWSLPTTVQFQTASN